MPLNDLAPSHRERLRDDAVKLRDLLRRVRGAKTDARDFALFDVRDQLAGMGVPTTQIDAFDAHDDDALDHHIGQAHAMAAALGAEDDQDHPALFGDGGHDVLRGGIGADALTAPFKKAVQLSKGEVPRSLDQARRAGVVDRDGRPVALNNQFDAERHARWSYRMAKDINPAFATAVGIGHEITGLARFPSLGEALMDLHNNGVGIGQAKAGGAAPDMKTPGLQWMQGKNARYPSAP